MCCDECHHFCVSDWPTPAILSRFGHMPDRPVSRWRGQQTYAVLLRLVLALRPAASVAPCHWRAINPGSGRYATVTHGRPATQVRPRVLADHGDLQASTRLLPTLLPRTRPTPDAEQQNWNGRPVGSQRWTCLDGPPPPTDLRVPWPVMTERVASPGSP